MVIGKIKGYKFCTVNKKVIAKSEMFNELREYFSDVLKVVAEAVNNNEFVIGLIKKKSLKVIYVFEKNEKDNSLKIYKKYKTKEISEDIINQFEYVVQEELKEQIAYGDITAIDWGEFVIKSKDKKFSIEAFLMFLALGLVYGIFFDNLLLGLLMGVAMGGTCGMVIEKKEKKGKECETGEEKNGDEENED